MTRSSWPGIALVVLSIVGELACAREVADPGAGVLDFSSPKSVLGSVFWAARTGSSDHLSSLCAETSNASARRICDVTPASGDWDSFRASFSRARINGEPRISSDTAVLKFVYGADGSKAETMTLVRRDGRWLLERF